MMDEEHGEADEAGEKIFKPKKKANTRQYVHFLCTMRADSPTFEFGGQPRHPET